MAKFKKWLRKKREKHNLTQKDLAKLVGTGNANISSIERGKSLPSLKLYMRIRKLFTKK